MTKVEAEEEVAPPLEGGDSRARNKILQSKTSARCNFRLAQPSRLAILPRLRSTVSSTLARYTNKAHDAFTLTASLYRYSCS